MKDIFNVKATPDKLVPYRFGGDNVRTCQMPLSEDAFVKKYAKKAEIAWSYPSGFEQIRDRFGEEVYYMTNGEIEEKYGSDIANEVEDIMMDDNFPLAEQFKLGYEREEAEKAREAEEYNEQYIAKRNAEDEREERYAAEHLKEVQRRNEARHAQEAKDRNYNPSYFTQARIALGRVDQILNDGFDSKKNIVSNCAKVAASLKSNHQSHSVWFKIFRPISYLAEAYCLNKIKTDVLSASFSQMNAKEQTETVKVTPEEFDAAVNAEMEKNQKSLEARDVDKEINTLSPIAQQPGLEEDKMPVFDPSKPFEAQAEKGEKSPFTEGVQPVQKAGPTVTE